MKTILKTLGVLLVPVIYLTGCDMGPACLESHTEYQVQVQIDPSTGQPKVVPVYVSVCDRYEEQP